MKALWKSWNQLRTAANKVLGINRRNLDLVFPDYKPGKFRILDDKLKSKDILERTGIPVPETLGVVDERNEDHVRDILNEADEVAIKPAKGWGGRGILILRRVDGVWVRPDGKTMSVEAIASHVAEILTGNYSLDEDADCAVFERRIRPHEFYSELAPSGLCDLRIIVEKGAPIQAMVRVPTAASDGKANLHSGGMGLGVDIRSGTVTGAILRNRRVDRHPDTGKNVLNLKLPVWNGCRELAVRAAAAAKIDYVGVDIVVDARDGPLVLEINARPGLAIQLVNMECLQVKTRIVYGFADRLTHSINWTLMLILLMAPFLFHLWQKNHEERLVVDVGRDSVSEPITSMEPKNQTDSSDIEQEAMLEEIELTAISDTFALARAASKENNIEKAIQLYNSVLSDSDLAPFALNNLAILEKNRGNNVRALGHLNKAMSYYPAYVTGLFNKGLILRDDGRIDEAKFSFKKALELKPNHSKAWAALGKLLFDEKNYGEAVNALKKAVRYDPSSIRTRLWLGLSQRLMGNLEACRTTLTDLCSLDQYHEGAAYWLARTERDLVFASGAEMDSLSDLRKMLSPFAPSSARCRSLSAVIAAEIKDTAEALDLLRDLGRSNNRSDYHHIAEATVALRIGFWSRCIEAAKAGQSSYPEAAQQLNWLADLGSALERNAGKPLPILSDSDPFMRLIVSSVNGNVQASRSHLSEVGQTPWTMWIATGDWTTAEKPRLPDDLAPFANDSRSLDDWIGHPEKPPIELLLYMSLILAESRDNADLATVFREALLAENVGFLPLRVESFKKALAENSLNLARSIGDEILTLDYGDPFFLLDLADIHCRIGSYRQAKAIMSRLSNAKRATPEARLIAGRIAVREKRYQNAIQAMSNMLEKDPENEYALLILGEAYESTDQLRKAENVLRRAQDLYPSNVDVRRLLALVFMQRRKYEDAVIAWQEVFAMDRATMPDRFNYALSLQRNGNEQSALNAYDALLKLDPDRTSALFNRGLALERLGRIDEAQAAFKRLLEVKPDHEAGRKKLTSLSGKK